MAVRAALSSRTKAAGALLFGTCVALNAGSAAAEVNSPRVDFMLECQGCHRPGGIGMPEIGVPRLKGHVSKFLHSAEGRAFLLRVPGVAQAALSDGRLTAVMNWMVREFDPDNLPADFEDYQVDEVARWRRQILRNVNQVRGPILEASGFDPNDGYR
ncbi:MAG: hypothetical protein O7B81_14680 [Gammaproteobacteria bacterium]|nr:hypothetical protein [Gammaproteobacteria bacterium]MCZ6770468.1 hypothetical protein [Pseudomonadota bacterium]